MPSAFTDQQLVAYIEETLPLDQSVAVETALRSSTPLQHRLRSLLADYDIGPVSLGAIWRQRHVSCPNRTTWQAFLHDQIHGEFREYLQFHLDVIGCRYCAANVSDLQTREDAQTRSRVEKIFATSVGHLHKASGRGHS
ncbi:hypothetical protein GC163_05430 [bacterium]|nr:hypothetical protein [bacterium]